VQLFWTMIVGPWILWKIRNIKDVHSWAWQTRLAIIAGYVRLYHELFTQLTRILAFPGRLFGSPSRTLTCPKSSTSTNSSHQLDGKCSQFENFIVNSNTVI
jgi:hypothetical protein